MTDYTGAIYGLIGLGVVLTVGVVFVLAQPTDLPVLKGQKAELKSALQKKDPSQRPESLVPTGRFSYQRLRPFLQRNPNVPLHHL